MTAETRVSHLSASRAGAGSGVVIDMRIWQAQAFCAYSSGGLLRTSWPCNAIGAGTARDGCRAKMTAMAMNADHARMCQLPLPSVQTPLQSSRSILRIVLLKMASTLAAVFVCVACASPVAAFRGGAASTPSPAAASIRTGPTASFDPSTSDAARHVPVHVRGAWAVGIAISTYAVCQGIYILSTHVMRNQLRAAGEHLHQLYVCWHSHTYV